MTYEHLTATVIEAARYVGVVLAENQAAFIAGSLMGELAKHYILTERDAFPRGGSTRNLSEGSEK